MNTPTLIFVDVETGGVNPFRYPLIEVGYVIHNDGVTIHEEAFSLWFDEEKCDPKALKVNGYGKREFAPRMDPQEAADNLLNDWVDATGIIACPVTFDITFIQYWLHGMAREPSWHYRAPTDLRSFFLGTFRTVDNISLSQISRHVDVPEPADRHGALADARWMVDIFKTLNVYGV